MTDRTDIAAFLWAAFGFSPTEAETVARRIMPDEQDEKEKDRAIVQRLLAEDWGREVDDDQVAEEPAL